MSTRWDLTAYNRDSQLVLVVEVKSKLDATPKWAAQLRRNILAHGTFPNAPYFLMVFPDRFYLWKRSSVAERYHNFTQTVWARALASGLRTALRCIVSTTGDYWRWMTHQHRRMPLTLCYR